MSDQNLGEADPQLPSTGKLGLPTTVFYFAATNGLSITAVGVATGVTLRVALDVSEGVALAVSEGVALAVSEGVALAVSVGGAKGDSEGIAVIGG